MKAILKRDIVKILDHVLTVGIGHMHDLVEECQRIQADASLSQEEKDAQVEQQSAQMFHLLMVLEPALSLAWFSLPSDMAFVTWCKTTFAQIKEDIELDPCVCKGCKTEL